jgi:hypothetical protein
MFDEKAYREHLEKFTKEQLIDLYIQKCFDEYMTKLYGEGGEDTGPWTSGYSQEINSDGTSKYPIPEHIETTAYCSGCAEKDKIIADLEKELRKNKNAL